jgi:hypothetical protein
MMTSRLVRRISCAFAFVVGFAAAVTIPGCVLIWSCVCDGQPRPLDEQTIESCSVRVRSAQGGTDVLPFGSFEPTAHASPASLMIEYVVDGDTFTATYERWQ